MAPCCALLEATALAMSPHLSFPRSRSSTVVCDARGPQSLTPDERAVWNAKAIAMNKADLREEDAAAATNDEEEDISTPACAHIEVGALAVPSC